MTEREPQSPEVRADQERFLGASQIVGSGTYAAILGLPWDAGVTYRSGAIAGPPAIRAASDSIETYCPKLRADLADGTYADLGDLEIPKTESVRKTIDELQASIAKLPDVPLLGLGGDHLAAYPFLARAITKHPDLQIFHIDAHGDLRDDWEGEPFNHSTVLRRVLDLMKTPACLHQWGIRSGLRAEFELAQADPRICRVDNTAQAGLDCARSLAASGRPIYVTLDVDGVDPADIPGTGTPEPDGLRYGAVEAAIGALCSSAAGQDSRLVGADIVELAPGLDPSGRSSVAVARLVRTLLLVMRGAA